MLTTASDSHVVFVTWPERTRRVRRTTSWVHVERYLENRKRWRNVISFVADDEHQTHGIETAMRLKP